MDESGRVFALTHNYAGYPMVREARARVLADEIGAVRIVNDGVAGVRFIEACVASDRAGAVWVETQARTMRSAPE